MDLNEMNDMSEFLKKAMESEMNVEDSEKEMPDNIEFGSIKKLASVLSSGKMVKIGRTAMDTKEKMIDELVNYLSNLDKTDKASWHAHASVKIQSVAKKLAILETILSTMTLTCMASEDQYKDAINTIIQLNCM